MNIRSLFLALTCFTFFTPVQVYGQNEVVGKSILAPAPRPKRPDFSETRFPITFFHNERIAFVGNATAERMNLFGHFETMLHSAYPKEQLVVRNFGRPADEVASRQRPGNYTLLDDPLLAFGADTYFCFFGFNESFSKELSTDGFVRDYLHFLGETAKLYPRDDSGAPPRFILVSPIAAEDTGDPLKPSASDRNKLLEKYAEAVEAVGAQTGWPVLRLFKETQSEFRTQPSLQFTTNGVHCDERGDFLVAKLLMKQLQLSDSSRSTFEAIGVDAAYQKLRSAVNDKSWVHAQDYRMLNGWYVYGGRRTWDEETFPREYLKLRKMAEIRDDYVWKLASGADASPPDDKQTGELMVPATRFGDSRQEYSEPKELRYLDPVELIEKTTVPKGFEIQLFADETMFPELTKPVQLDFDNRGRLWVACMPTYPQWRPGDKAPDDRLLILDDKNHDGKADSCTVFYDKLHCPTGFEFYNGGVLVVDQPRLMFLKDTDGDDKADVVIDVMDGWGTDDTHHTIGAFEFSNGGLLYMLEGVAMSTTLESPWGPQRWNGSAGSYVFDPRTLKTTRFTTPGYGNPWMMMFEPWGQGIVGDGTGSQQHWATGLSGSQVGPRRGLDAICDNQGMRPSIGNEIILSRHFPDEFQGQYTYACVINMNGMPRFKIDEDGAAFFGKRIMNADGTPDDLMRSSDKNFRPVNPTIGPDGTLWFGDWCNALIGHMQYSQRDPNRDHTRGRIYRLVAKDRDLLSPVTQFGKSELELFEQLKVYEPRTRYRVRRELQARPTELVTKAAIAWVASLKDKTPEVDRLRMEALWILQSHHIVDSELLNKVLSCKTANARAAAVRYVSDLQDVIPDAIDYFERMASDESIRVRAEVARAASFIETARGVHVVLKVAAQVTDKWLDYLLEHSIGALESVWTPMQESGALANVEQPALDAIDKFLASARPGLAAKSHIDLLLQPPTTAAQVKRNNSYAALEALKGNADNGKAVFGRVCANCHIISGKGFAYGPELTDVGRRLNRHDLIESIVEPSAKMDKKYLSEIILLDGGEILTGFIGTETETEILLLMPEGKQRNINKEDIEERKTAMQSSMPENLGSTIASSEFLDLMEYLASLK